MSFHVEDAGETGSGRTNLRYTAYKTFLSWTYNDQAFLLFCFQEDVWLHHSVILRKWAFQLQVNFLLNSVLILQITLLRVCDKFNVYSLRLCFKIFGICENETFMALWNKNHAFKKTVKLYHTVQTTIENQCLLTPLCLEAGDICFEKDIFHLSELLNWIQYKILLKVCWNIYCEIGDYWFYEFEFLYSDVL